MIKLSYMKEYISLAEILNFTKTANKLSITQPALSRHITLIEEEMGTLLFLRNTKTVSLTPAGKEVYDSFLLIIDSYEKTKKHIALSSIGKTGSLRISDPYYWSEDYVDPIVLHFKRLYPQIKLSIKSCQPSEGVFMVQDYQSDIALSVFLDKTHHNLNRFDFAIERLCVVLSIKHPMANLPYIKLEDLKDQDFIFLSANTLDITEGNSLYNNFIFNLISKRNFKPRRIIYSQQVDTLGITILETGGISIMPYGLRKMKREYIRTIPLEEPDCKIVMSFYYSSDNTNPAIPLFLESVKHVFSYNPDVCI